MAQAKVITSQTDFSAGEVDPTIRRNEAHPAFKAGAAACSNFRILDTAGLSNRFGRSIKFIDDARIDEVLMAPGQAFELVFGNHKLSVRNAAGAVVFTSALLGDGVTAIPWTTATVKSIGWDISRYSIYITYADGAPANVPQVLTWDGVSQTSTWTLATYTEQVIGAVQKRTPFYRISPQGVTLAPSATSGSVTLMASSAIFVAAHVGTRLRWVGRQLLITAVGGPFPSTTCTATVKETLNSTITFTTFGDDPRAQYSIGDEVIGQGNGASGIITSMTSTIVHVVMLTGLQFTHGSSANDTLVGPSGSTSFNGTTWSPIAPEAVLDWDDEVMNAYRGYPASVFFDQQRLGFCNFPSIPSGIGWSAIGTPTDLYVPTTNLTSASAIFEIAPGKSQVLYVAGGNESSEFVFCDNAVYYIPITAANPLSGTTGAAFLRISGDGCAPVRPALAQDALVYINAGLSSVRAILTAGATNRPNESHDISEFHNHLFKTPIAVAAPSADGPFPERYLYVLNGDGTAVVGKFDVENGQIKGQPGWVPMSGNGSIAWISARGANVWFTTTYTPTVTVAELLDSTQYLDAALPYNAVPTALTPPGGKGPLWWLPSGTCTVLDLGTRQMGDYQIDADGFLVPQNFGGENLASAQLVVGQGWTAILEPFIPSPGPGQDTRQRMIKRMISEAMAYVTSSTGFLWQKLYSGPLGPNLPALGDVVGEQRVATYNQDDDATKASYLREDAYFYKPAGASHNPRFRIVKDTPGPLVIEEISTEVTV